MSVLNTTTTSTTGRLQHHRSPTLPLMCTVGCVNYCTFCIEKIITTTEILQMGDVPGVALKVEEIIGLGIALFFIVGTV